MQEEESSAVTMDTFANENDKVPTFLLPFIVTELKYFCHPFKFPAASTAWSAPILWIEKWVRHIFCNNENALCASCQIFIGSTHRHRRQGAEGASAPAGKICKYQP